MFLTRLQCGYCDSNVMLLPLRLLRLLPLPLPQNRQMLLLQNHPSSSFSWQKHPPDRLQWLL
jgi:hypothetical protein